MANGCVQLLWFLFQVSHLLQYRVLSFWYIWTRPFSFSEDMQNWHTRLVKYSYGVIRITVDKEACTVQCTRTLHV